MKLARWPDSRAEVERALYPALENDPGRAIWQRNFKGASGLFGIVLKPVARHAAAAFMTPLALFSMGYSWGGFEGPIVPARIKHTAKPFKRMAALFGFMPVSKTPTTLSPTSSRRWSGCGLHHEPRHFTLPISRHRLVRRRWARRRNRAILSQCRDTLAGVRVPGITFADPCDRRRDLLVRRLPVAVAQRETSGHTQWFIETYVICHRNALVLIVNKIGPICHIGKRTSHLSNTSLYRAGR